MSTSKLFLQTLFLLALITCSQMVSAKANGNRSLSSRTTQSPYLSSTEKKQANLVEARFSKFSSQLAEYSAESQTISSATMSYSRRLAGILEQLSFAFTQGWLDKQQFDDFKNWHASVAMEELLFRQKNGGSIQACDAQRLERHLNGLDIAADAAINAGSKVANIGNGAM